MNYKILKKVDFSRVVKYLTIVVAIFLAANINSALALPNCATLTGVTPSPGVNCSFFGLPHCSTLPTSAQHRVNCADLADLPLCMEVTRNAYIARPGINCVNECSDPSLTNPNPGAVPALVRGIDYAVHNQHCIRFCDAPEAGFTQTISPDGNCVSRKCHQLPAGVDPTASNCTNIACNLLTTDELSNPKFEFVIPAGYDPASPTAPIPKKYCEGENLKCFQFEQEKLRYLATGNRVRAVNTMCKLHSCPTPSPLCGGTVDVGTIQAKGTAYFNEYVKQITRNLGLDNVYYCEQAKCNPIVQVPYRCSPPEDDLPTELNTNCDKGSTCDSDGFCQATVDCNDDKNKARDVCITSSESDDGAIGTVDDVTNAWFYRPTPMDKSLKDDEHKTFLNFRNGDFCYSKSQFLDYWGTDTKLFGWAHSYNLPDKTRSPGMCGVTQVGNRAVGYINLCGTKGRVYTKVDSDTAYFRGYTITDFSENDATHQVRVCLRYNNTMHPWDGGSEACGKRQCGVICGFSLCKNQACGFDVCRTLTVRDSNPQHCKMSTRLFNNNLDRECMASFGGGASMDSYLRVRAVKYGNKICSFLDVKGQFAYKKMFLNGSEKISQTMADGTIQEYCLSGELDPATKACVAAKDSNDEKTLADKWRTILKIPYIGNNQPDSDELDGYFDQDGRFFKAQDCIKTPLRISPPPLYNIGTIDNSTKLFTPQIYILNAMTKRDGVISPGENGNLGLTDFNYPEVQVQVGLNTAKLSLGLGYDGSETTNIDPKGVAHVETNIPGLQYTANLFVRKSFDANHLPIFCLFEKIPNSSGELVVTGRGCVKRKMPDIDNSSQRSINPTLDPRRVLISRVNLMGRLNNSKISLSYCTTPDNCSQSVTLENTNTTSLYCSYELERYKICSKREECTKLNVECMQNEIDLLAADSVDGPIIQFLNKRDECNNVLLPYCNAKRGITDNAGATIINQNPKGVATNSNYYGWFNEICIVSGFESKLKQVIAKLTDSGAMGKCIIDSRSPYLNDGNPSTNCNDGGKAPNCLCLEAACQIDPESPYLIDDNPSTNCDNGPNEPHCLCIAGSQVEPQVGEEVRRQTPREAGLCVDMPLPQVCPEIKYNLNPNPDFSDADYTAESLNKNEDLINISHLYRARGNVSNPQITLKGHAEFPAAIPGALNVSGQCKGFWKYATNNAGVILRPKLSCLFNGNNANWEDNTRNPCVRYSCQAVLTAGPDQAGIYQGGYGAGEVGANVGKNHGFSIWPPYTKTNDSLQDVTATACIPGYKKQEDASHPLNVQKDNNSKIIGYSGGLDPIRKCNQLGQFYGDVINPCVPITCKKHNLKTDPNTMTMSDWYAWQAVGGAVFQDINASRSQVRTQTAPAAFNSVQTGTCNESLGFFQSPGGEPPSMECDHMGNWKNLRNPCVTRCSAISDENVAKNSNNGFAFWKSENSVPLGGEVSSLSTGCATDSVDKTNIYYRYPYPPLKDKYGNSFTISDTGPFRTDSNLIDTIPRDVSLDTRSLSLPERTCKSVIITGNSINVWTATSSNCVNRCPGAEVDPRIGVGKTSHEVISSTGVVSTVIVDWPSSTWSGTGYQYYTNCSNLTAGSFTQGRNNGCYALRRKCNVGGKWSDAEPICVANSGVIGNATYKVPAPAPASGMENSAVADASPPISVIGECVTGTWASNSTPGTPGTGFPVRQCVYETGNTYINKTYWKLTSNADCTGVSCPGSALIEASAANKRTLFNPPASSGFNTTITGSCVNTATLMAAPYPTATCTSNGTWSPIANAQNCKYGCISGPYGFYTKDTAGSGWSQTTYTFQGAPAPANKSAYGIPVRIRHGETIDVNGTAKNSSGNCMYGQLSLMCNDGVISHVLKGGGTNENDQGRCDYFFKYNWALGYWQSMTGYDSKGYGIPVAGYVGSNNYSCTPDKSRETWPAGVPYRCSVYGVDNILYYYNIEMSDRNIDL